jgi:hypothetical protein
MGLIHNDEIRTMRQKASPTPLRLGIVQAYNNMAIVAKNMMVTRRQLPLQLRHSPRSHHNRINIELIS